MEGLEARGLVGPVHRLPGSPLVRGRDAASLAEVAHSLVAKRLVGTSSGPSSAAKMGVIRTEPAFRVALTTHCVNRATEHVTSRVIGV